MGSTYTEANTIPAAEDALLDWPHLHPAYVPLSRSTVWALRRAGKFPEPVRISATRVAWRKSEILKWIDERAEGDRLGMRAQR